MNGRGTWARDTSTLSPLLSEWLIVVADKGPKEARTHQPISEQLLEDITQRLQLLAVSLSHPVPLVGLRNGALTYERRKRCARVIP
jgi:hypothetical protein